MSTDRDHPELERLLGTVRQAVTARVPVLDTATPASTAARRVASVALVAAVGL